MVTENIGVSFEDKKSLDIQVNIGGNEAFQVPVHINSLDAEKVGQQIGEIITGDFDETLLANVAKEETLLEVKTAIENIRGSSGDIDLTGVAKENTLLTESAAIQSKIDNIQLPDIDTTELAKQGENQEATNSNILTALNGIATTMYRGIPVVTHDVPAGGTEYITILPNRYNIVNIQGEVNLVVIKGEEEQGIVNNYMMRINANGTLNSMKFDGWELVWYGGTAPSVKQEELKLELCIIDNLALWTKF